MLFLLICSLLWFGFWCTRRISSSLAKLVSSLFFVSATAVAIIGFGTLRGSILLLAALCAVGLLQALIKPTSALFPK